MELASFSYQKDRGWNPANFPDLDSRQTLVLAFAAPDYFNQPTALKELAHAYPLSHIIGCSTAGEILADQLHDQSISVAVTRFEHTQLRHASAELKSAADSRAVGSQLAEELLDDELKAVFILAEGLQINGSQLVQGLRDVLPDQVIITGGLAGDGTRFAETALLINDTVKRNSVAAIGFYGNRVQIGHGSMGGWDIFGPERKITRSQDNILYELDNQPALALYKRYLGDMAAELPASGLMFPLAIRKNRDAAPIVRTILAVDEAEQSLTFAGDIPDDYLAQLMKANFDRLIDGAHGAAEMAGQTLLSSEPVLSIAISCVGRRLALGERIEEELEVTLESLPPTTQQAGFYSYGEISPEASGRCRLHNQTMTLTTISEHD